jgi:Tol biopolymer transport system component
VVSQSQTELVSFDRQSSQFVPFLDGLSAEMVEFSRDGKWVSYVTNPERELWRSQVDGSQKVQLSGDLQVLVAKWSPDGKQISFSTPFSQGGKFYLVSAEGGTPEALPAGDVPVAGHDWSADGKTIVLGTWPPEKAPFLRLLDVKTRQISTVPGSEGMTVPIWSPDGRYIAATEDSNQGRRAILEVSSRRWTDLPIRDSNFWAWSHDSKYIYFIKGPPQDSAVFRLAMSDRKIEQVLSMKGLRRAEGGAGRWLGLGPHDSPMVLRGLNSQQIYSIDWEAP